VAGAVDNLLGPFQGFQHAQFLLDGLLLDRGGGTSLAGLPNFYLKYSSRVLLERRFAWMELRLSSDAVDLLA
jgi:hypothetical protein